MKTSLILLLAFVLSSFSKFGSASPSRSSKWIISESSKLTVNGKTNVNSFSCGLRQYTKADTLVISQSEKDELILSGEIRVEVKNFDCSNQIMTRELRKTLKENEYPTFRVRFISLKSPLVMKQKEVMSTGVVEISIAGATKRFEINYRLRREKNGMLFTGYQLLNFSDFKLDPPRKMGRLIKAKDELGIVFLLRMEAVS